MKQFYVIFPFLALLFTSCITTSQYSSGINLSDRDYSLPDGIPNTVAVLTFEGDEPYNIQSSEQFSAGLLQLGFKVIERVKADIIIDEYEWQQSDFVNEDTRVGIGEHLGIDGLFLGSITVHADDFTIMSYINIKGASGFMVGNL